ncbi:MAG: formate hydrogenlyase subunit 3/multisubunit Na+/H+ antiporter MnhD subunit [Lentimonas sp.]|jgi:formate hydrogenlyase subunit 3/multisubunit Na+/H+ antiporter MnhD subunit
MKPYLKVFFVLAMAVVGGLIISHYWSSEQFSAIKQVPVALMVTILIYIGLHFFKRLIFRELIWWDWLYYIALFSIVLPVLFANSQNENLFHWLVDLGTMFFIIPLAFDVKQMIKSRKKHS